MIRGLLAAAMLAACTLVGSGAEAQQRLRWAHVYETGEAYHTEALWAADQIRQRTQNRWNIEVFPASALGNEPTINQGLTLGTVDIIYTGVAFAGATYKPIAIGNAPYVFRDYGHFAAYRESDLLRELMAGYDKQTGHRSVALTYYGARHLTANRPIMKPEDARGMKLRVPQAPLFLMFTKSIGANATPIAFAEVYLALQQGTVDGQENPLPTIRAKKFYEVQSHIMLSGHITESLLTIVSRSTWARLNDGDRKIFEQVLREASDRASREIRDAELKLPDWFREQGKTVATPDLAAFRAAALPLHNDAAAGAGWTRAQYDRLQAIESRPE